MVVWVRSVFDSRRECQYILWNNKEIPVDNKPVFYKKLFEQDVIFINDLLFDTTNSFTIVSNKISKINYLNWAGLRHSVPKHLKNSNCLCSEISLIIKRIITQCPKKSKHLCQDFNLTQLRPAEKSIPSSTWGSVWTLSKSFSIQSV